MRDDVYFELVSPTTLEPLTNRVKATIKGDHATGKDLVPYKPFVASVLRVIIFGEKDQYHGIDPMMVAPPDGWQGLNFTVSVSLLVLGLPTELERLRLQNESLTIQFHQAMNLLVDNGIDTSSIGHARGIATRVNGAV